MFRRNFLKWLGITPAVGLTFQEGYQPIINDNLSIPPRGGSGISPFKEDENPNNLPIVQFNKNGYIKNYKELLGDKNEVLVFIRKEDCIKDKDIIYGEVVLFCFLEYMNRVGYLIFKTTENTKTLKTPNLSNYWVENWRNNNVS